jgi:hypothetical protein
MLKRFFDADSEYRKGVRSKLIYENFRVYIKLVEVLASKEKLDEAMTKKRKYAKLKML